MDPINGLWHVLNFFAPAAGVAFIACALAKLVWRRELKSQTLFRLWMPSFAVAALVSVLGLVVFTRDGKMASYAALVLSIALVLWWKVPSKS
jgi:L-asparagine transporter-like permease